MSATERPTIIALPATGANSQLVYRAATERAARLRMPLVVLRHASAPPSCAQVLEEARQHRAGFIVTEPGPLAVELTRTAAEPVLVVQPSREGAVVGATDLSEPELPALRWAAMEARLADAPLCFFHAVGTDWIDDLASSPEIAAQLQQAQLDAVRQSLRSVAERLAADVRVHADDGDAATRLRALATTLPARLIVVATRKRSPVLGKLHRCSIDSLVSAPPCSVLVVKKRRRSVGEWLLDRLLIA